MKEKIARLEQELEVQRQQNNEILQKLYQMQDARCKMKVTMISKIVHTANN